MISSPLGCIAVGCAFLGTAGIVHQTTEFKRVESARIMWGDPAALDLRDAPRDETMAREQKRPRNGKRVSRDKALRDEMTNALTKAVADLKVARR